MVALGTVLFVAQAAKDTSIPVGWRRTCYLALHVLPGVFFGAGAFIHVGVAAVVMAACGGVSLFVIAFFSSWFGTGPGEG